LGGGGLGFLVNEDQPRSKVAEYKNGVEEASNSAHQRITLRVGECTIAFGNFHVESGKFLRDYEMAVDDVWDARCEFVKVAAADHDRIVLLGDFNAHLHKLHAIPDRSFPLHNPKSEANGKHLAKLLEERRLVILNGRSGDRPPAPTRYPPQSTSKKGSKPKATMIDLVAVGTEDFNLGRAKDLKVWNLRIEVSDHRLVTALITIPPGIQSARVSVEHDMAALPEGCVSAHTMRAIRYAGLQRPDERKRAQRAVNAELRTLRPLSMASWDAVQAYYKDYVCAIKRALETTLGSLDPGNTPVPRGGEHSHLADNRRIAALGKRRKSTSNGRWQHARGPGPT
jgi:hypothetical protein